MRYRTIILPLLIVAAVALVPCAVHAAGDGTSSIFGSAISNTFLGLLDLIRSALEIFGALLRSLMATMGDILQSIISLQLTYGGPTVYAVWKILRDMCNMLFIVLFVLVAFSTIFNSFLKSNPFFYKSALVGIFLAAITINFSLALGQTVVWAGNYASQLVIGWMGPSNIGAQIATSLNLPAIQVGQVTAAVPAPQTGDVSFDQLTPQQQRTVQAWGVRSGTQPGAQQALTYLRTCLTANGNPSACYQQALQLTLNAQVTGFDQAAAQQNASWLNQVKDVWGWWTSTAANGWSGARLPQQTAASGPADTKTQVALIVNALLTDFLLLVLDLSFLAVLIFMVIRIPAIWLLLSFSSIAFFTIAIPNSEMFKKWFNNLLGWCIFSPLYLFVIYIGLFFISQSGSLTASLTNAQAPFFAGAVSNILFFLIAGFIFIGGAAWVMNLSFKLSSSAGAAFGKIGGAFGMTGEYGAVGAVYKGIGLQSRVTGAAKGLTSVAERNIAAPLKRREEEATARYQALFGDRGALEKLEISRINEQIKKNKESGASVASLRKNLSGTGTDYFAAANALLEAGELNDKEIKEYGEKAAKVSPSYGQVVREQIQKKLREKVKEKKYKKVDDVLDAMEQLQLNKPGNDRELKSFLGNLKSNQPLLYAKLAGNTKGIPVTDKDGNALTTSQILEEVAPKLSDEEWLSAYEDQMPLGDNASYVLNSKLTSKGDYNKLLRLAKKETREKLAAEIKTRRKEQVRKQMEEKEEAQEIRNEVKKERKQQAAKQPPQQPPQT